MRTCFLKVALVVVLGRSALFVALAGDAAALQDSQPGTGLQCASCLVKITFTSELALDRKTAQAMLGTSGILGAAVAEVPGLDGQAADSVDVGIGEFNESVTPDGDRMLRTALFEVNVFLQADRSQAGQILRGVCRRLESELKQHSAVEQQHLRTQSAEVKASVKQAEQRLQEVQSVQQELFAGAGQSELSRKAIVEEIKANEREQRDLDMKLAALHARQRALAEQIARIGSQAGAQVDNDPVVIELAKVVQLREAELKFKQQGFKDGRTFFDEEEALALARAELAKQRQAASQRAGGELLADLNKELVSLAVDIAETEAQREFIRQRLTLVREKGLLELADRYEREVEQQLASAEQVLHDALRRQVDLEERLATYRPPMVSVLGGPGENP